MAEALDVRVVPHGRKTHAAAPAFRSGAACRVVGSVGWRFESEPALDKDGSCLRSVDVQCLIVNFHLPGRMGACG